MAAKHYGHRFQPQPCRIVARANTSPTALVDIIADADVRDELLNSALNNLQANPMASTALIQLLRKNRQFSVEEGLMLESLTYSTLQHGTEFTRWLNERTVSNPNSGTPARPVITRREVMI